MRYNFLTDSYEEEYSAFVTDFSKYEVVDVEKKEVNSKKFTNFVDEEIETEIKTDIETETKTNIVEEKILPTINEEEVKGYILEDFFLEDKEEKTEYIFENEWMKELEKLNDTENLEKISAQLTEIDVKLGRICDYIEKIYNV